jgi:hypothetical protein
MTSLIHGSLAFFMALLFYPQQQAEFTGDWYFDRFGGPHGEVAHSEDIDKANKQQAGSKFTFTNDGKFRTIQQDGTRNTMDYGYLASRREIILGKDTLKIMLLTAKIMELYPVSGKQPTLFLKRSKNVRTAMSAP